ncbi:MAG TPA: phage portal protein [Ilumatobacteraceae bacterium]
MSFWSWLTGSPNHADVAPNDNDPTPPPGTVGSSAYNPGDPDGVELQGFDETFSRSLPVIMPSPWSGWPAEWNVPNWDFGSRFNELVDVAWDCLDLNSSVLSTMPVYRTQSGVIIQAKTWMTNPDPTIYSSWHEFAKQLFWDYQLGEAFVLPIANGADGYPLTFRVIPPWMMHVEMRGGMREYRLGGPQGVIVSDEILHIRYKSTTDSAHGVGPLEAAGGRMLTAGVLAKYVREVVKNGGVPYYTLETDQELEPDDAQDLLAQWVASRQQNLGAPPVLDKNVSLKTHQAMSPKDMAMLEIAQFTEARIAVALGVPPFLVGLPSGGDSMTYSNVSQLFDFHDRASLRPKATAVMSGLSAWALPSTQKAELNRDEYSRPSFEERADAWVKLVTAGIVSVEEVRMAERLTGQAPTAALTGGEQ